MTVAPSNLMPCAIRVSPSCGAGGTLAPRSLLPFAPALVCSVGPPAAALFLILLHLHAVDGANAGDLLAHGQRIVLLRAELPLAGGLRCRLGLRIALEHRFEPGKDLLFVLPA